MAKNTKYIFCLEGDWTADLRCKQSIKSTLDYLENCFNIKYIHCKCVTKEQLYYYLKEAMKAKYRKYSILYFAFHGTPDYIDVGDDDVSMSDIMEFCKGKLHNRIIHFGSCSTLKIPLCYINEFKEETGTISLSGYKKDMDFTPSTVLDILLFEAWQFCNDSSEIKRYMNHNYKEIMKKQGFYIK